MHFPEHIVTRGIQRPALVVLSLMVGLLSGGCSDGAPQAMEAQGVVSGKVMYRERVALPPNVTVTVLLADVSRADAPMKVLAEEHIDNPGQMPVPFSLRYQPAAVTATHPLAYAVRAEIRAENGKLLWTTAQRYPVDLSSEAGVEEVTVMLQRVAEAGDVIPALSPAMREARSAGANFWAMGNEPGWHAAIYPDERIEFVGDYGNTRMTFPYGAPEVTGGQMRYQSANERHQLQLSITEARCQDSTSGREYDYSVTVQVDNDEYNGCGMIL